MSRKLDGARRQLPVTADSIYLATGSWGPVSKVFASTLRRCTLDDLREGRLSEARFAQMEAATVSIRASLAGLVGCRPEALALAQSTSAGLETVINGLPWQDGDEIICTQLEHPACTSPLRALTRRRAVSVRLAQVPEHDAADLGWLEKCVSARTRLIAMTGVSYSTGQRLPFEAIGAFGQEHGIATLLDGAQCVGAIPLDLDASGIDYCAFPLQKWLSGPEGMGALYVRDDSFEDLRRDRLSQPRAVLVASAAHLEWLGERIGWPFVCERTRELAGQARAELARVPEVRMVTPDDHAGLITIESSLPHVRIAKRLGRKKVVLRSWPEQARYRLSTAWFNTEAEIDTAVGVFRARARNSKSGRPV